MNFATKRCWLLGCMRVDEGKKVDEAIVSHFAKVILKIKSNVQQRSRQVYLDCIFASDKYLTLIKVKVNTNQNNCFKAFNLN